MATRTRPRSRSVSQERQQADQALRAEVAELLSDPDAVVALIEQLAATCKSPKILGYSLRNQAMLMLQAQARGMRLRDVDTYKGWRRRGLGVKRGEQGLRIVRPRGTENTSDDGENDGDQPSHTDSAATAAADQVEGSEPQPGRTRFRMAAVFEINQTQPLEDAEEIGGAHVVPNPAAVLAETLTGQLERAGFELVTDADCGTAEIDDSEAVVIIPPGHPVGELARALAQIHAARCDET